MYGIFLTNFARKRHFDPSFAGTKILSMDDRAFEKAVNKARPLARLAGYAPFCEHHFVANMTDATMGVHEITPKNEHLLHSGYVARRESELPVLERWFSRKDVEPARAPYLDLVLYSRAKLIEEGEPVPANGDWGIVAILSSVDLAEAPMSPITMMRNALGKDQGGSGWPLRSDDYAKSVAYWSRYATVQ